MPPRTHTSRRTQLITLPAVIANHARRMLIRFSTKWPWADEFHTLLNAIRALPEPSG